MALLINKENFKKEVLESKIPVLIDFYADWCPPCQILSPIIEELAKKYQGKIKIGKFNVDEGEEIVTKYQILSVPTLIIFKDGKEEKRIVGLISKKELEKILMTF